MAEKMGEGLLRHIALHSATALVVANIIGAGIFTTTGFQAADLGHPGYIFLLWIVGGVLALCGALCYGELGAAMPHAGAEYVYLRETYGRLFGFMSAFVSLVAGFSAPIAAATKSFAFYGGQFLPGFVSDAPVIWFLRASDLVALGLVWLLVGVHLRGARGGIGFNDLVTLLKVCGIAGVVLAAFAFGRGDWANLSAVAPHYHSLSPTGKLSAFGTSLIFVSFCYSGWNAAAYVAGEMTDPQRHLPRALLGGTAIVVVLYLGLNAAFFYGADANALAGKIEVGLISTRTLFGPAGATATAIIICVSILASASAMTIAGPRVYYAFGHDFELLRGLSSANSRTGAPTRALLLQGVVTSIIVVSGRVDQIQQYAGFTLALFGALAVSCVIVLRIRRPDMPRPFRVIGYPVTPLLFLAITVWTMYWAAQGRPQESMFGVATVLAGGVLFYALSGRRRQDAR